MLFLFAIFFVHVLSQGSCEDKALLWSFYGDQSCKSIGSVTAAEMIAGQSLELLCSGQFYSVTAQGATLGPGLTEETYYKDACPILYKDVCETCATGSCVDNTALLWRAYGQDYFCETIADTGMITSDFCSYQFNTFTNQGAELGPGITEETYFKDACPILYKDVCETCASALPVPTELSTPDLTVYWDKGACGKYRNDQNWNVCGRNKKDCPKERNVASCANGKATLTKFGTKLTIDGCYYLYVAIYECKEETSLLKINQALKKALKAALN